LIQYPAKSKLDDFPCCIEEWRFINEDTGELRVGEDEPTIEGDLLLDRRGTDLGEIVGEGNMFCCS